MVNKYGADALRLYLINSPVVRSLGAAACCCQRALPGTASSRSACIALEVPPPHFSAPLLALLVIAQPPRRRVHSSLTPSPAPPPIVCPLLLPLLPQVRAETLKFKEEGVFAVVKDVFLPWYNAYRWAALLRCAAAPLRCCAAGWWGCCDALQAVCAAVSAGCAALLGQPTPMPCPARSKHIVPLDPAFRARRCEQQLCLLAFPYNP